MRFFVLLALIGACTAKPVSPKIVEQTCKDFLNKAQTDYGFFPDTDSCSKYFQCYRVHLNGKMHYQSTIHTCPEHTVWNQNHQTCQWDLNGNGCEVDPCTYSDAPFADAKNCGTFYMCVNDDPIKMCCPPGLGYNQLTQACDDATCGSLCEQLVDNELPVNDTGISIATDECLNGDYIYSPHSVQDGVSAYYMSDVMRNNVESNMCPDEAPVFSLNDCGCIASGHAAPGFSSDETCYTYDYSESYGLLKDGTSHWVDVANVEIRDGALCMSGDGKAEIPFYASNSFGQYLRLGFTMGMDSVAMNSGTVLTNGDDITTPSIEVKIDSGDVVVTVVADSVCTVRQTFNEGSNHVSVTYDGYELALDVSQGLLSQTIIQTAQCSGNIHVTSDPLRLGVGYTGCLDDLSICKK